MPALAHLIHHRAVARDRQVLWPERFATERNALDAGPGGSAVGKMVNKVGLVREFVVHWNYILFYRTLEQTSTVEILRVKHAAQQIP